MKVKKYVATTMPEAMKQIRKELGQNAVILNSKEVFEGGFLGLFKKRKIEVIAALDETPIPPKSKEPVMKRPPQKENKGYNSKTNISNDVLHEIQSLKKLVMHQANNHSSKFELDYQVLYQHLLDQEILPDLAEEIVVAIQDKYKDLQEDPNLSQLLIEAQTKIKNQLLHLSFKGIMYQTKVVHFIGPTGVGKTTTIAKVAARSVLQDKKRVAFITMDTYRIAAIEQLKTYAQIIDIPVEVAYSLDDYQRAVTKFADYDLIMVDTAGRNFRDEKYVKDLKRNIDDSIPYENYLVLSLTAKPKDILDIYDSFHLIPIKEIIFTKMDETTQYGSIYNLTVKKQVGVAYLTNGQDVPDDILSVSPNFISKLIVGDELGT